jgi:hypothetical protein
MCNSVQKCYKCLCVNSKAGKFNQRSGDTIRIDLREIRREGVDWIQGDQNRIQWRAQVNTA